MQRRFLRAAFPGKNAGFLVAGLQKWEAWKRLGVKASEMESDFVCGGGCSGRRCGSCFHVIWNQEREKAGLDQNMSEDTSSAVLVGIEALKLMIQRDREKESFSDF